MAIIDAVVNYRRWLKRRNCSAHTLRTYMNTLRHFVLWLALPIEEVGPRIVQDFIDHLIAKGLNPKTINCYLDSVRGFYNYLIHEEQVKIVNPVKRGYLLRLSRPLPRHLRDEEIPRLFAVINSKRDRAIFMLMLRCGLRVEEVAKMSLQALDLPRSQLFVYQGKGNKGRVVYLIQRHTL
jgi:site-specific recombinase XerD